MNSTKNLWVALVAVAIIAIGTLFVAFHPPVAGSTGVTACNGGNCTNFDAVDSLRGYWVNGTQFISRTFATLGTLTEGGGVSASSTSLATATLLSTDFDTENWIDYTANVSSVTLSLPASTTFPLGTTAGQCRQFGIRNATTTAGITLTIAGGTGTLLKGVSTSSASVASFKTILGDTDGSNNALLNACRKANSDIIVDVVPYND